MGLNIMKRIRAWMRARSYEGVMKAMDDESTKRFMIDLLHGYAKQTSNELDDLLVEIVKQRLFSGNGVEMSSSSMLEDWNLLEEFVSRRYKHLTNPDVQQVIRLVQRLIRLLPDSDTKRQITALVNNTRLG